LELEREPLLVAADAAVAARRPRPPGVVGVGHRALELIDVADEVTLTPLEGLLHLFELRPPALDAILAKLDVGLEFGLSLVEIALPAAQFQHPGVHDLLRNHLGSRFGLPRKEGRERRSLLSRDLDPKDEGLGRKRFVRHKAAALSASPAGRPSAIPRASVFRQTRSVRILVAEDETIIRLDLKALLERAGFEVCAEARDGEEAVALARESAPDVAIMDVKMPKLDGIEAARRILDERPIPIVMLTAYGQDELVQRAAEAGVFGYLVKPFREQDLLPAIRTARARHEELAALREEAESLAEALTARKAIERAKGLLMEKEGLSEQDAFARLRKASQISGRPLKVVAEALIATFSD
jgi:AmiR/NasT family two-component response regulator